MSFKFRKSVFRNHESKRKSSIGSLQDHLGDRLITKYPLPYSYDCSPDQERSFPDEIINASHNIKESKQDMLRLTKVIVVGDVAVGKTCLVRRFCLQPFDSNYKATIGVDFEAKKFYILDLPFILQMWDTAGQEKFKCIAPSYYRGAKVVVLVFDFSHLESLYNVRLWLERTLESTENPLLFLVGTKKDTIAKSAFKLTEQEAVKIAKDIGAEYCPVSSKTGEHIELLVSRIAVTSFCRSIVKEAEAVQEVKVSNDFVRMNKAKKKKVPKCMACS